MRHFTPEATGKLQGAAHCLFTQWAVRRLSVEGRKKRKRGVERMQRPVGEVPPANGAAPLTPAALGFCAALVRETRCTRVRRHGAAGPHYDREVFTEGPAGDSDPPPSPPTLVKAVHPPGLLLSALQNMVTALRFLSSLLLCSPFYLGGQSLFNACFKSCAKLNKRKEFSTNSLCHFNHLHYKRSLLSF